MADCAKEAHPPHSADYPLFCCIQTRHRPAQSTKPAWCSTTCIGNTWHLHNPALPLSTLAPDVCVLQPKVAHNRNQPQNNHVSLTGHSCKLKRVSEHAAEQV